LYDTLLKGKNGITVTMQRGAFTAEHVGVTKQDGYDLVSTLDMPVQDIAETALRACLDSNDADFGCVIVMEVASGNIVAITNLMKDDNYAKRYTEQWSFAIGSRFEPGSTIKLATLLAVLEDGMQLSNKVKGNELNVRDRTIKDDHYYGDSLTLQTAFEYSSNAGMASAALQRFGKKEAKFTDYLIKWHLNTKLDIGFKGEKDPLFITPANKKDWHGTALAYAAHGYFEEYSPMQIITLYNAVANNGKMVKPRFAKELRYPNTNDVHKTFDTVVLCEKICSDSTLAAARQCLEGVVLRGTGKSLKNMPFAIAGKTGTAVVNYDQKDQKKQYRATWIGYFPADSPKYTCYVMIANPKKNKIYAAELAIPVFTSIVKKISNEMHAVPKNEMPNAERQVSTNNSTVGSKPHYVKTFNSEEITKIINAGKIPNLIGCSSKDAVYILEKMGIKVKLLNKGGIVSSQSIEAGNNVVKGTTIILTLS
jgi:cell division protein FtsI (penicillin-binding protein 3)